MSAPRLEACYFSGPDRQAKWPRLARVLEQTAAAWCPGWQRRIVALDPPAITANSANGRTFACNTYKLDHWRDVVLNSEDGERLLLIDADTMILRSIDDIWTTAFDLAYTTKAIPREAQLRAADRFPFNGGVVFLRVSGRIKVFVAAWADENRRMLEDPLRHEPWRYRYGGINQASLGRLLKEGAAAGLALRPLPCAEWNCEDSTWAAFQPYATRILHVKGDLRHACFHPYARTPELSPLAALWLASDRVATPTEAIA